MNLFEGLRIGAIEIRSHKLRAFLTLFGIAVGITSIVAMTAILSGFKAGMHDGMKRFGMGRLFVTARATNDHTSRSSGLLYEDALAIRERFPNARAVSPIASIETVLFYGETNAKALVNGITPDWAKLGWSYRLHGRFFNDSDLREYGQVCVLVKKLQKKEKADAWRQDDPLAPLFRRHDPLRKMIRLGHASFRVVGVLEELPQEDNFNDGDRAADVLIPLTSFQKRLSLEQKQLDEIDVDSGDLVSSYGLAKQVFSLMKRRHRGVEDFQVMNMADFMGPFFQWLDMASFVMFAVAAIALFAGGVGIMNITLASVNARVKEIGIRKSVGARERDIRLQFLLEAAALSLLGGMLGVLFGGGACLLVKATTKMSVLISPLLVGASLAVSVGIGVAFSWYPARRAARLDPMEALRCD